MPGTENAVAFGNGVRLESCSNANAVTMQKTATDVSILNISGSPEGVTAANPSSLAHDRTNGILYVKKTGIGNTGWQQVSQGASVAETFITDAGTAIPVSDIINILGSGSTQTTGSGNTVTTQLAGLTNHNVLVGAGTTTITKVAPSATSGVPFISQGASSDPAFGTAVVAGGGTGQTTLTNHGVLIGQSTSAIASTAAGSAGQVLQSGGASADPAYSTATYPSTAGTSGKILISNGTNIVSSTPTYPNAASTLGKIIQSDGTNFITSTPTWPTSIAQGDLVYGSATSTVSALAKDTNSTRYLSNTGASNSPAWAQVALSTGVSDYSTGTWTPTVTGGTTNPTVTYAVQRGMYVKIGRLCFLSGVVTFNSFTGGSGPLQISNLPFNDAGDLCFPLGGASLKSVNYSGNYTCSVILDLGGTTVIEFTQSGPNTNFAEIQIDNFTASSEITFTVCYRTNS